MPALALLALLGGCGDKKEQAAAPPPKPQVGVVTLKAQPVALVTELPGRTSAFRVAEVRPQVSGIIQKRLFTEGDNVRAGQQLYQIDPAPYEASLESAKASLARAKAAVTSAQLTVNRYKPLVQAQAVSRQDLDNAVATLAQAQADVATSNASIRTAEINLAYTKVYSPIDGRTGRSSVTEGALVTGEQSTVLVTVTQLDPIYVDVTQPSTTLLRLKRELAAGQIKATGDNQAQVNLVLEDGADYAAPGRLQFSEVNVDEGTGSVVLRAVFPNTDTLLLPGMFVRERIEEGVNPKGILVPQRGVTRNQRGEATALVVNDQGKVEGRVLATDRIVGTNWLVTKGVGEGDRVIVEGVQKAHSGAEVDAKEFDPKAPAEAGSGQNGAAAPANGAQPDSTAK